jgi:outer membrane protein insertion porin family
MCVLLLILFAGSARAETDTSTTATSTAADAEFDAHFDDEDEAEFEEEEEDGSPFRRNAQFIEAIEIVGNAKTERAVIMRRLLVSVGDLLDETLVEESRLRLLNTGYFKSVEFSLRRGSRRGRVLLLVEVDERNTILLDQLYLGFSSVAPFYGGFGIVETNFLGKGVSASSGFVVGKDRRAVELKLFVPDLSNTPLQLSSSAIILNGAELLDERDASGLQLTYERIGGTLGLGVGVGPAQRVSLDYRLESIQVDRLPNVDPAILRRAPQIQFGDSVLSSLSLIYERDTRDDPFVPTQGSRLVLGVELGTELIGSSYEFTKYTADLQAAVLMFREHSLILRLFGGLVQGAAPFFNQFFISDYAYFAFGRDSLPRNVQLNFSESNDYDDLIVSVGADYSIPIQEGGDLLYRMFVYGGVDVSATASLNELQEDATGRGTGGHVPLSFDAGLKFDTWIGNFTLSLSYMLDLVF